METCFGIAIVVVGAGLMGSHRSLASRVHASGAGFFGKTWRRLDRFNYIIVGGVFMVGGLLLIFDVMDFKQ